MAENNTSTIISKVWSRGVLYDDGVSYGDYFIATYMIFQNGRCIPNLRITATLVFRRVIPGRDEQPFRSRT